MGVNIVNREVLRRELQSLEFGLTLRISAMLAAAAATTVALVKLL